MTTLHRGLTRAMNLHGLLTTASRAQLTEAWRALTAEERAELRSSKALAQHAWSLIIRDRILTDAAHPKES